MSELSARKPSVRKTPVLSETPIVVAEPDAKSKKLEATKAKYEIAKEKVTPKISVGSTKSIDSKTAQEYSIQDGSSLKKLRIKGVP